MTYEVYVNGKMEISVLSIEDLMYYIQVNVNVLYSSKWVIYH